KNDLTGNGFSADDTAQGGVTINLYAGTSASGSPLASTVTAGDGSYALNNLATGTYFVQEVVPANSTQTGGIAGYVVVVGSGGVGSGGTASGENFDNFKNITISGTKFTDLTGNGFSGDDTPLAGVTIQLFKNGGSTPVATTVTAADG